MIRMNVSPFRKRLIIGTAALLAALVFVAPGASALTLKWQAIYDRDDRDDAAAGIALAPDGTVAVTGHTTGTDGGTDVWIGKFSAKGKLLWKRKVDSLGESVLNDDSGEGVAVASDGSVYVAATLWKVGDVQRIWLGKYSAAGAKLWTRKLRGKEGVAGGVAVAPDGSVYLAGSVVTASQGYDAWLRKFSPAGTRLWTKTFNNVFDNDDDMGTAVATDANGNAYLAGNMREPGIDSRHTFLIKYRPDGSAAWNRQTYLMGGVERYPRSIAVAGNGAVYLAGSHDSFFNKQGYLSKYSKTGDFKWTKYVYNEGNGGLDYGCYGATVRPSGNVLITGGAEVSGEGMNILLREYAPDGTLNWEEIDSDLLGLFQSGRGVASTPTGAFYVGATKQSLTFDTNIWLGKYR